MWGKRSGAGCGGGLLEALGQGDAPASWKAFRGQTSLLLSRETGEYEAWNDGNNPDPKGKPSSAGSQH